MVRTLLSKLSFEVEPLFGIKVGRKNKKPKEGSTINKYFKIFSQMLQLFPLFEFQQLVKETKAERHVCSFLAEPGWSQFVAMLFCQLGRANSLRENR